MTQIQEKPAPADVPLPVAPSSLRDSAAVLLGIFAIVAFIGWIISGVYNVAQGEVAIVERLGQYLSNGDHTKAVEIEPGLHFGFPWPIDRVHRINISQTRTIEISSFDVSPDRLNTVKARMMRDDPRYTKEFLDAVLDPYLITGDLNMLHLKVVVNYRIKDPEAYVNSFADDAIEKFDQEAPAPNTPSKNPEEEELRRQDRIQQFVEYVLTRQLATVKVNDALGIRAPTAEAIEAGPSPKNDLGGPADASQPAGAEVAAAEANGDHSLQNTLTEPTKAVFTFNDPEDAKQLYDMGILIGKVDVTSISAPTYVRPAFDNLIRAQAQASVSIIQARTDAANEANKANADVETIARQADGYAKQQIQQASGDASRFSQVYAKYKTDPLTTKFDLYTDCVNTILNANNRPYYVMPGQKIVLPISAPEERIRPDLNSPGGPPPQGGQGGPPAGGNPG